jgi:DNA repair photolyase
MVEAQKEAVRKGRGAHRNPSGRYEPETRFPIDDGWWADDAPAPLETQVFQDSARKVITRNSSPDVAFDRSINPYRGCEHGCAYCFARVSHSYLGLSPGLDFETKIFAKQEAPALLEHELRRKGYVAKPIALGVNTDAYQPIERQLKITRGILEVLDAFNHPVSIVTKSAGILRDLDILGSMASRNLASVVVSVTTLDGTLARRMEPRAAAPQNRLRAIRGLHDAGVPVAVLAAPMIPGLNDAELEAILSAAHDADAGQAGYVLLRLPLELKELFVEWLEAHYPDRANKVVSLMRQSRGGALYQNEFGKRMAGTGAYADLLGQRFEVARRRLGLVGRHLALNCSQFAPPVREGDQLALF